MPMPVSSIPQIGILGGGPGGLMTAYLLQKRVNRPIAVTLFEASERLGGKILTARFDSTPVTYEAGAAEFYGYSHIDEDPLAELIEELELSTAPMGGNSVYLHGRFVGHLEDFEQLAGRDARHALEHFYGWARDRMSPTEYYLAGGGESAVPSDPSQRFDATLRSIADSGARRFVEVLIHSDLAAEPDQTSVDYGLQNYLMNDPAYLRLYGIVGGNESLPQRLAARLDADFRLNQRVTHVGRSESGRLQVRSRSASANDEGERSCSDEFDFVVAALPLDALTSIGFEGDRLADAMLLHRSQHDYPAHYLRITILFRRPFWTGRLLDSYCMLDALGGCCLYDESSRVAEPSHGVLGWLLGGRAAVEYAKLTDQDLIELALTSLPPELGDGRANFLEGRVHRWIGAVNAIPGGLIPWSLDRRHQPEPCEHATLFVVGDYLFDSTINGVLDSADYVSNWLATLINSDAESMTAGGSQ